MPVPVRGTVAVVEWCPSRAMKYLGEYANKRLPVRLPPDCGAKVSVKDTLCPGASVNGALSPLRLNPVPDSVAWKMVRAHLPELFTTTDCETLLPIATLPKFTAEGVTANCPLAAAVNRRTFRKTNPQPMEVHGKS
jgi:hypothetical protein